MPWLRRWHCVCAMRRGASMRVAWGFGSDIDVYLRKLRFDEDYARDVFHVALKQKTDVHIADLAAGGAGHGIPAWFMRAQPQRCAAVPSLIVQDHRWVHRRRARTLRWTATRTRGIAAGAGVAQSAGARPVTASNDRP